MTNKRIAIMQPYLFPYIGYFQLIDAVDTFVFFNDVYFIKKGWINRNRILVQQKPHFFTIPCVDVSQNRAINETRIVSDSKWKNKLLKTVELAYKKAPYFHEGFSLFESVITQPIDIISDMAQLSLRLTCQYLGLTSPFFYESAQLPRISDANRSDRLIQLAQENESNLLINPIGGGFLYDPHYFEQFGISINLLQFKLTEYSQWKNSVFTGGLSILDCIFFHSPENIRTTILPGYSLIQHIEPYVRTTEKSV